MQAAAFEGLLERGGKRRQDGRRPVTSPPGIPHPDDVSGATEAGPTGEQETLCDHEATTGWAATGGFLIAAYEWLTGADQRRGTANRETRKARSSPQTYFGNELVASRPRPPPPGLALLKRRTCTSRDRTHRPRRHAIYETSDAVRALRRHPHEPALGHKKGHRPRHRPRRDFVDPDVATSRLNFHPARA
jgi:hypothetical protein